MYRIINGVQMYAYLQLAAVGTDVKKKRHHTTKTCMSNAPAPPHAHANKKRTNW